MNPDDSNDSWSEWLQSGRYGGSDAQRRRIDAQVEQIRDRVLDGASLKPDMTIADLGAGDGLLAFAAINRIGSSIRAVLTDISRPLMERAERRAEERGVRDQCRFLVGSADKLDGIADASIDVVMTRAVLAYVMDKRSAMGECFRVLAPGGRLSIAEPIFRDQALEAMSLAELFRNKPPSAGADFMRLIQRWKAAQYPSTEDQIRQSAIANFSERDLVRIAQETGFINIHLELHIDVRPSLMTEWDVYINTAPHPLAPPLKEIFQTCFSESERQLFERVMRPIVESGKTTDTDTIAYMTANKPTKI